VSLLLFVVNGNILAVMLHTSSSGSSSTQSVLLLPSIGTEDLTIEVIMMSVDDSGGWPKRLLIRIKHFASLFSHHVSYVTRVSHVQPPALHQSMEG
jgi:hypothetical protein